MREHSTTFKYKALNKSAVCYTVDVAIVAISQFAREGSDRESLSFDETSGQQCQVVPSHQDELVQAVAAANTNTVVAATTPGPVLMPWKDSVNAILLGFIMPGQEYGQ